MSNEINQADRQPVPLVAYLGYGEERARGIDLLELVRELRSRFKLVVSIISGFVILGVVWALVAPPIYKAEVVLAPAQPMRGASIGGRLGGLASLAGLNLNAGGDNTQAVAILSSRAFVESFIADNDLLPVLYFDEWDSEAKAWKESDPAEQPTLWGAVRFFMDEVMSVKQDDVTGLVTLSIEWFDAELAARWAEELVRRINEQLRTRDLAESERKLEYLNSELGRANLLEVRQAISSVVEEQVQTITLAKGESEYAFRTIDPARVPMKRDRPQRILIVVLATMAGGVVSLGTVILLLFVNRARREAQPS